MLTAEPNYWVKYYHGTDAQLHLKRKYSFSDRSRYYFAQPAVVAAEKKLLEIPLTVLSQYLPVEYELIREGKLENDPVAMLEYKCQRVQDRYFSSMLKAKGSVR